MGWHMHQLDHMEIIYTSLQTGNHASTSSLNFFTGQIFFLMPNQQRTRHRLSCINNGHETVVVEAAAAVEICWVFHLIMYVISVSEYASEWDDISFTADVLLTGISKDCRRHNFEDSQSCTSAVFAFIIYLLPAVLFTSCLLVWIVFKTLHLFHDSSITAEQGEMPRPASVVKKQG